MHGWRPLFGRYSDVAMPALVLILLSSAPTRAWRIFPSRGIQDTYNLVGTLCYEIKLNDAHTKRPKTSEFVRHFRTFCVSNGWSAQQPASYRFLARFFVYSQASKRALNWAKPISDGSERKQNVGRTTLASESGPYCRVSAPPRNRPAHRNR